MTTLNRQQLHNIQFGAQRLNELTRKQLTDAFSKRQVLVVDVDTNNDFFSYSENGDDPNPLNRVGLPVEGAGENPGEGIRPNIERLTNALVRDRKDFRLATLDTMGTAEEDAEHKEFLGISKEHCVAGTEGHKKIQETLIEGEDVHYMTVNPHNNQDFGFLESMKSSVFFEKNAFNFGEYRPDIATMETVENLMAKQLLEYLRDNVGYKVAVVYGLATDYCVKGTVETLKKFGFTPFVVNDAVKAVDPEMDDLLTTSPDHKLYNDETYGDVTVLSTNDVLNIAGNAKKQGPN